MNKFFIFLAVLFASCNCEEYVSEEFTIGNNTDYVQFKTVIQAKNGRYYIDGVKVDEVSITDSTIKFENLTFKIK